MCTSPSKNLTRDLGRVNSWLCLFKRGDFSNSTHLWFYNPGPSLDPLLVFMKAGVVEGRGSYKRVGSTWAPRRKGWWSKNGKMTQKSCLVLWPASFVDLQKWAISCPISSKPNPTDRQWEVSCLLTRGCILMPMSPESLFLHGACQSDRHPGGKWGDYNKSYVEFLILLLCFIMDII